VPRIAVLGANGQVGAELCLLLAQDPSIDLVPVCRNRTGSAYLRWMGLRCRHGRPADAADAPFLFGDCDFILNSALASGSPAVMRRAEDAIVRNAFRCSPPHAKVIHFSTQSVYGDARPGKLIRWRSLYGRAKLATESCVRSEARSSGKSAYLLRLGHVGGTLQDISNNIRREINEDRVILPEVDSASNLVYTATIVDAILTIIRGGAAPGCYDLMNVPQWNWRQVYEYEAASAGSELRATVVRTPRRVSRSRRLVNATARVVSDLAGGSMVRQMVAASLAHLPTELSARAEAWWYCKRARTELAALGQSQPAAEHLSWVANGVHFLPGLRPTVDVLAHPQPAAFFQQPVSRQHSHSWAEDLPRAAVGPTALPAIQERPS
jgi:nucleoside-diphosphate-sugar epimerase